MEDNPFGAAGISIGMIALLALAGLLLYRHLNGRWPWQSAAVTGLNKGLPLGRARPIVNRQSLAAAQRRALPPGRPADQVAAREPEGASRMKDLGPTGPDPWDMNVVLLRP